MEVIKKLAGAALVGVALVSCGEKKVVPQMDLSTVPVVETSTTSTTTSTTSTTSTTKTTTTMTVTTTTKPIETATTTSTTVIVTEPPTQAPVVVTTVAPSTESQSEIFVGSFSRGTFYTTGSYGGSGRTLVSRYSIASRALYEWYGYGDYKVRIECDALPELNGIYSLDDCSAPGNYEVIDFWFAPGCVPAYFQTMGVFEVRAYIVY